MKERAIGTGKRIKYVRSEQNALATPALIGERLILRTEKHLYSIRNAAATSPAR
jgi:hypothetical protein